jgi:Cysteine-rich CWC
MNTPATATLCPLCGQENQCAMDIERGTGVKQAPCWCVLAKFDVDLLASVPADKRNLACICATCATSVALQGQLHDGV